MRFPKIVLAGLAGLAAAGLVGCSGSSSPSASGGSTGPGPGTATAPVPLSPSPSGHASTGSGSHASAAAPGGSGGSRGSGGSGGQGGSGGGGPVGSSPPTGPTTPHKGGPETKEGARAAAAHFYRLYFAGRFTASWNLLTPAVKRQVPRDLWVRVHNRCPVADGRSARVITAVTVFGNAAIVTERIQGTATGRGMAEDVFSFSGGRWGYSPSNLGIYQHHSVRADVAAAKAAGLCGGGKAAPL